MTGEEEVQDEWWKTWIAWTVNNPWDFAYYFVLCVSPILLISLLLSWKLLHKSQPQSGKDKKRGQKKSSGGGASKGRPSRTLRSNSSKAD